MNLNIKNKFLIGAFASLGLITSSCVNNDDYDFADTSDLKANVVIAQTEFTAAEGETINIPITIEPALNKPVHLKILASGDAEMDVDYATGDEHIPGDWGDPQSGYKVTIPAYTESYNLEFTALRDLAVSEEGEQAVLNISAAGIRTGLIEGESTDVTVTLADEISNEFIWRLDWGQSYTGTDGETHSFCDFDLDLEIYDSSLANTVATSYSDCPEQINILEGDLPDGTYYLVPSYWSPAGAVAPTDYESIPAEITIAKRGVFVETIDFSGVWTNFQQGANEGNPNGYVPFASLEISNNGTTYNVSDFNTGETIVEGRMANFTPSFRGRR